MSGSGDEEEEVPATHTGPKGVIHDWRKFKLESEDHESMTQKRRELLRQMSNPRPNVDDDPERVNRKMSVQEYEMIKEEDEQSLKKYRKQCMQEMHERLSFGPRFDSVLELESGEAFLEAIENEHHLTLVVVHIYDNSIKGCEALNNCLTCLAAEYCTVKFCRIQASVTGADEKFSDDVLPTVLVYKGGEMLGNFICVTKHLSEEFFATDVENFLNEYGLLPEKEFAACSDKEEEEHGVE
ncbi:phosducin a [Astyanax mexicanus]|uniref:phosducin a n=1 Tax=Astyanax mexicanus TaxID=7994 RepID=UPI0020CAF31F|nr:phosducin a [Astyanax mexicanus]